MHELATTLADLIKNGITVTFEPLFNQTIVRLSRENQVEQTALPDDHLSEHKLVKYLKLMGDKYD